MECLRCGDKTRTYGTKSTGLATMRYRRCDNCDARFRTMEIPEHNAKNDQKDIKMPEEIDGMK